MQQRFSGRVRSILLGGAIVAVCAIAAIATYGRGYPDRVYRIGWENNPPFQESGQDGQPTGLVVELVREAARRRGIRLEWVKQAASEAALRSRAVDLWPLLTVTPERRGVVYISEPYLQHEYYFLVPSASPYQKPSDVGNAIVSHFDQPINLRMARKVLPEATLLAHSTWVETIESVCRGQAQAALVDEFNGLEGLLAGPQCAGHQLRMIAVSELRPTLGVGSTLETRAVADALRDEIGTMAHAGLLAPILRRWGYFSPRTIESTLALLNARERERRLVLVIALFVVLTAFSVLQADRIRRERNRNKRTAQALRESERKLRLLANNLQEMVLAYDMSRRLVFANPAVEQITGYAAAELEQRGFVCWVHPEDQERMVGYWDKVFQGDSYADEEYRLVSRDGVEKWVSATWGPIRDEDGRQIGVQGVERDITDGKRAEQALRESERRFRELLESAQLVAIMVNLCGKVAFFNRFAESITGWTEDAVIGRAASDIFAPPHRAELVQAIELAGQSGLAAPLPESALLTPKGDLRWVEWSCTALRDADGKTVGLALLGVDVTEHRQLRERYLQAQKLESVGRLAGGIAHDFNNLLTVINGYSDLVWEQLPDGSKERDRVGEIRRAGQHAVDLTQQLLTFSRKQAPKKKSLNLNALIRENASMLGRLVGAQVEVVTRLDPALGYVLADATQIAQVLMNLVVNARDAMPDGGRIVIGTANIQIDASMSARHPGVKPGPYVMLTVADTGVGIDPEMQRRIFDPFFTTKDAGRGTGLGLSTVFGIAQQNDGWVWVSSEPGKGSEFYVYLPRGAAGSDASEKPRTAPASGAQAGTVMLVEDQESVRGMAVDVLRQGGYEVLAAAHGRDAMLTAELHCGPIDLLITDVIMPEMCGPELVRSLRPLRPSMRVLFISGYPQRGDNGTALLEPGDICLPKPFSPAELMAKVQEMLATPASGG